MNLQNKYSTTNWFRLGLLCNLGNIKPKKAKIPDILTEKINTKYGQKVHIFWRKFKFQIACPPSPSEPNELKFCVCGRGFYH